MVQIDIKDFTQHATKNFRRVREERTRYVITDRGQPVAMVMPLDANLPADAPDEDVKAAESRRLSRLELREELDALHAEIERAWTSDASAVDELRAS